MIDLHCHLLPGVDDGPATLDDALALAARSSETGVTTAVATPHLSARYPTSTEAADAAADGLRAGLAAVGSTLDLLVGAEIAIDQLARLDEADLERRTLGDGRCLLIESPFQDAPDNLEYVIHDLVVAGYDVLLAHPERSWYFHQHPELLERLCDRGVRCSLTAASFRGSFGAPVKAEAVRLAGLGLAHNVSSDTHDLKGRKPGLDTGTEPIPGLPSQEERDALAASLLGL